MKTVSARLIVFFIGLPAIELLIIFVPGLNHLGINALVVAFSALGTREFIELLRHRGIRLSAMLIVPLTLCVSVGSYLSSAGWINEWLYMVLLTLPPAVAVVVLTLRRYGDEFDGMLAETTGTIAALVYPTYFMAFLIRVAALPYPTLSFVCFLSMVFANDTSAYVFGMLFGRSSRGISRISPNKSVPGFVAGPIFSLIVAMLFYRFAPELFDWKIGLAIGAAIAVGAATIVGDLFESALKRSARVKDSGVLVPGRGGVLDSIDSVALAAPFFYLILSAVR